MQPVAESLLFNVAWPGTALPDRLEAGKPQQPFSLEVLPQRSVDISFSHELQVQLRAAPYEGKIEYNYDLHPILTLPVTILTAGTPSEEALYLTWKYARERRSRSSHLVFTQPGDTRKVEQVLRDGYFYKHLRLALKTGALGDSLGVAERIIERNPGERPSRDLQLALSIAQELFAA